MATPPTLLRNDEITSRLNMILWGDSKAGKTTYAMSAPGRKLIINFDPDGFEAVAYRDDFDVLDLSTYRGADCINAAKKAAAQVAENAENYSTVIVDSLTTLTIQAVHAAIENRIGQSPKFTPSLEAPGLSAWGARNSYVNDVVERILRVTAKHNLHCILIAHMDDPETSDDGKTVIRQTMLLSAKIKAPTAIRTSEIWHMSYSNSGRKIYIAPHGVKEPMGSRMFNTEKVKQFTLNYDITKPDDEQPCAIATLFNSWRDNGKKKLVVAPQ